jgi:CheY-like chemotaxis protein
MVFSVPATGFPNSICSRGTAKDNRVNQPPFVIIAEDSPSNARLVKAILEPSGYRFRTVSNGREALQAVSESIPDIILMDIGMPVMDGIEATRILKSDETTRMIPVLMITAETGLSSRIQALEAGADDFMSKPVDRLELRIRVKTLLEVKAYHDHLIDYQKKLETDVAERTEQLEEALRIQTRAVDEIKEAWQFTQSILDSLSAHICVIDGPGNILFVNEAWRNFASLNPPSEASGYIGANYLKICDTATGTSAEGAAEFAVGIREVLEGIRGEFFMEYPCHAPWEQRWFLGRVTRFSVKESPYVVIAHENITRRKSMEEMVRGFRVHPS